jgi:hypothetical protein
LTSLSRGRDCCIKHLHAPAEEEVLAKSPVAPLVPVWGAHNAGRNGTVGPYTSASVYANSVRHRSMSDLTAVLKVCQFRSVRSLCRCSGQWWDSLTRPVSSVPQWWRCAVLMLAE